MSNFNKNKSYYFKKGMAHMKSTNSILNMLILELGCPC